MAHIGPYVRVQAKGQLISKRLFGVVDFLQKTNENKSFWGIIVVKSNSFVCFLEEMDDQKKHFEINWPLVFWQGSIHFDLYYQEHMKLIVSNRFQRKKKSEVDSSWAIFP